MCQSSLNIECDDALAKVAMITELNLSKYRIASINKYVIREEQSRIATGTRENQWKYKT